MRFLSIGMTGIGPAIAGELGGGGVGATMQHFDVTPRRTDHHNIQVLKCAIDVGALV